MALPVYTEFLLRESSINTIGKKIFLSPRSLGNIGEAVAGLELEKKDYRIIANNFNTAEGEIDIIASRGNVLVFIEVKTRTSVDFGSPSESIDIYKARRIRKAAGFYLADRAAMEYQEYRFDIITVMIKRNILNRTLGAIIPDKSTREGISRIAAAIIDGCTIEHIEDAF
ncbi:MAG: YraN family protein [Actinobacteria bacterium]|nr:YraN family protein [Actinomycetota bacterium]